MRNKFIIGYVIFVHLFLLIVLIKSDFIAIVGYRFGLIKPADPILPEHYELMIKFHERMDPNVPDGAVIFIGDSITQGLYTSAVFNPSVNYGIGGDTTKGVLKRLPKYRSIKKARACIIAVGINDLRFRENEEILKNYQAIINSVPYNTPIIFSAVLPVDETVKRELAETNGRIKKLNSGLKTICEAHGKRCTFIDPHPKLIDSAGNLKEEYHEGDGIHLSGKGNAAWIKELSTVFNKSQTD